MVPVQTLMCNPRTAQVLSTSFQLRNHIFYVNYALNRLSKFQRKKYWNNKEFENLITSVSWPHLDDNNG